LFFFVKKIFQKLFSFMGVQNPYLKCNLIGLNINLTNHKSLSGDLGIVLAFNLESLTQKYFFVEKIKDLKTTF